MSTPDPTDLSLHVDWLKREVAVPGTFSTVFPETSDDDLAAAMVDGLYRSKFDGWLPDVQATSDIENPPFIANQALSKEAIAVIVLYAAIKFVQNQITNMVTRQTYKAPGVESTTERAPTVLAERLKELIEEKKNLLHAVQGGARPRTTVRVFDGYSVRAGDLRSLRA